MPVETPPITPKTGQKSLKIIVLVSAVLLIAAILLAFWRPKISDQEEKVVIPPPQTQRKTVSEALGEASSGPLSESISGIAGRFLKVDGGKIFIERNGQEQGLDLDREVIFVCTSTNLDETSEIKPFEVEKRQKIGSDALAGLLAPRERILLVSETPSSGSKIKAVASMKCE